ncbi:MAG: DUF2804 domain-containing protein [Thermodesulfobacteriota bacterium]|nr:DUF2804 domain-containing protein [Thermodesulfobacteriota bacterium]
MQTTLVKSNGTIDYGLIRSPVDCINFTAFDLQTPMGRPRSAFLKRFLFKQFVFMGINAPGISAGLAVVDLKYAANGFFYVYDRQSGALVETKKTTVPYAASIKPCPENIDAVFNTRALRIHVSGDQIRAESRDMVLDAAMTRETEPLRVCTKAGCSGWTYTQKTAPIGLAGTLRCNGRQFDLFPDTCKGITDWTAGYLRRETFWNWASAAGVLADGRPFGMNLACGVNETGVTENCFWLDGVQTKVDTVQFQFNPRATEEQWRVRSADGKVDLMFSPNAHRSEHLNIMVVASRFVQFMGTFSGKVVCDRHGETDITAMPGWTEDHFARW